MLKWVVELVKSEIQPKPKMAIEMKPIVKTRQLKLRKPSVHEPTVVSNPVRLRPPRRPRRSKQQPLDTSFFVAPARLTDLDLDKKSPQFRIAHVHHFKSLKSDFPVLDKTMYYEVNKSSLGVTLRRFQQWFNHYDADLDKVKSRRQNQRRNGIKTKSSVRRKGHVLYRSKSCGSILNNKIVVQCEKESTSSKRTKPNPKPQIRIPKKSMPSAMRNKEVQKTISDIKGTARTTSWPASKTIQIESIEAPLIHPFSKIIREGTYCILL